MPRKHTRKMFPFQINENVGRSADPTNYADVLKENLVSTAAAASGSRALPIGT